jgi:hypothetical protein
MLIKNSLNRLVNYIISFINTSDKFFPLFNHYKQKYNIKDLFTLLFYKLQYATPYRQIKNIKIEGINTVINGSTLKYFYDKLIRINFLEDFFKFINHKYVNKLGDKIDILYIDSTLIANKLGIDDISYNVQLKKHKSSKVSLVIDSFGVPIDYIVTNSKNHDASICIDHINNIVNNYPNMCDGNKKIIADAAYDSNKIRNALKNSNLGELICEKNKRNTKNPILLQANNIPLYTKMLLKSRSKIEHTNNIIKKNKTINNRYEKYVKNYTGFILLGLIKLAFNKFGAI